MVVCCWNHGQDEGTMQSLGSVWSALNAVAKRKRRDSFYFANVLLGIAQCIQLALCIKIWRQRENLKRE